MLSVVLATLCMLVLAVIAKALTGDWLHPSSLFCGFWGFSSCLAILIAPEDMTSGSGPLLICFYAALMVAGGVAGTAFACSSASRRQTALPNSAERDSCSFGKHANYLILRRLAAISIALGLTYVVLLLRSQGIGIGTFTSLRGLGQTAMKMSVERYSNTAQETGLVVQLLLSIVYFAPLVGGTLFVLRRRRSDVVFAFLTMLPCLASFIAQSTRSAVIYGLTMWIAGFLSTKIYCGKRLDRIRIGSIIRRMLPAVMGLFMIVALLRVGDALRTGLRPSRSNPTDHFLSNRVKNPLCGHFGALSYWVDNTNLFQISPSFGKYTFAGIYNLLQPGSRAIGVFSENAVLPTGETNIYTYFRPLIEDCSFAGSIIIMLGIGIAGGFLYRKVLESRVGWLPFLAPFYAWTLFGITSLFNYNSILLTFALYALLWFRPQKIVREPVWAR